MTVRLETVTHFHLSSLKRFGFGVCSQLDQAIRKKVFFSFSSKITYFTFYKISKEKDYFTKFEIIFIGPQALEVPRGAYLAMGLTVADKQHLKTFEQLRFHACDCQNGIKVKELKKGQALSLSKEWSFKKTAEWVSRDWFGTWAHSTFIVLSLLLLWLVWLLSLSG